MRAFVQASGKILQIDALRQCPRILVEFTVLLDGSHKDPRNRQDNGNGQHNQNGINQDMGAGPVFFFLFHLRPSLHFQNIPLGHMVDQRRQQEGKYKYNRTDRPCRSHSWSWCMPAYTYMTARPHLHRSGRRRVMAFTKRNAMLMVEIIKKVRSCGYLSRSAES